jgi:hypothetical protein
MNTFTLKLNKNINIQINDLFSIKTEATQYFVNSLENEIKDNELVNDINLKYNKYFFLIKYIFSIKNDECLILYSDKSYISDLENIVLPKNIVDKIYIPLYINNEEVLEEINSYDINYIVILDPVLCYKFRDIYNITSIDISFFNDIVIKYINMNILQINNNNLKLKINTEQTNKAHSSYKDSDIDIKYNTENELKYDTEIEKDSDIDTEKDSDTEIDLKHDSDTEIDLKHDSDIYIEKDSDTEIDLKHDSDIYIEKDSDTEIDLKHDSDTEIYLKHDSDTEIDLKHNSDIEIDLKHDSDIKIEKDSDIEIELEKCESKFHKDNFYNNTPLMNEKITLYDLYNNNITDTNENNKKYSNIENIDKIYDEKKINKYTKPVSKYTPDIKLGNLQYIFEEFKLDNKSNTESTYNFSDNIKLEDKPNSNKKKLTKEWYNGTTGILPIDVCIKNGFNNGYLHHIERLMVIGNFMVLSNINPKAGHRWFMEFSCDSYEWVMAQNVYDMVFFVSGGKTMRRPYISSSNYILKMSNYKKDEWCNKWDEMYNIFLKKNKKKLWKFRYFFRGLK